MSGNSPKNVNEALTRGGIPEHWTPDQLEWLEAKHRDLGTRGSSAANREWHARWANTAHDILVTLAATPRSERRR